MYPWRRIVVPTDFSTASEWVFDDAVRLAATTDAELVILHIRMTRASNPSQLRFPADPSLYDYAEQYELDKLRERVRNANEDLPTRLVVRKAPDPGAEICRAAAEENADLIVIATHARHHVAHLLIGSTTLSVMKSPPAPVLAVRYGIRKRSSMKRIVVPVHPKQTSQNALDLAAAIVRHDGGELHLLTICEEADRVIAETHISQLTADALHDVPVKRAVVHGSDVEKEIVRYVDKQHGEAVFLNAGQEPGQVKVDVVRGVGTPVMIVP
jgi:nucleotide-binding universal stress UspA family protein